MNLSTLQNLKTLQNFLSYISNNSWNPTPFNTTIKIESISADMTIIFLLDKYTYFTE